MSYGLRRFLVLVSVFLMAFIVVFVIRRLQTDEDFFAFLRSKGGGQEFRPEEFTLPTRAALDLDDVEMLQRLNEEYAKLTKAVVPSVVSIDTVGIKKERLRDWLGRVWERRYETEGIGSGVIVTHEGHIITNQHVIEDKTKIRVTTHDGKTYPARLIGEDPNLDIAVIRIEGDSDFQPLNFGDSDRVEKGQMVFAVGNPFGLGETVTQGIISNKEQSISDRRLDFFQTDAAINPGNSGGPLVNIFGEIIAINAAIYSPDAENRGFHGVGFSIPSNDVRDAFLQILERGRPVHGYLGVQALDLFPAVRASIGYRSGKGAMIDLVVKGSPAEKSGLQQYDVVQKYNGEQVQSRGHLFKLIQRTKVGNSVSLEVWRSGEEKALTAKIIDVLDAPDEGRAEPGTRSPSDQEIFNTIGIRVRNHSILAKQRGAKGVVVHGIITGSLADNHPKYPLMVDDVILGVNQIATNTTDDFYARLLTSAAVQETTLTVKRGVQTLNVTFPRVPRSL